MNAMDELHKALTVDLCRVRAHEFLDRVRDGADEPLHEINRALELLGEPVLEVTWLES